MPRSPTPLPLALALAGLVGGVTACGPDAARVETPADGDAPAAAPLPDTGRVYERSIVFLGTGTDSVFVVPWLLTVRTGGETAHRRSRGWLLRGGVWDPFLDASWETPPVRSPWRPLPHGPLRLRVGEGGALEEISFVDAGRRLDVSLDASLAEWTGRRGETFRFLDGGLVLAERRVPGLVLDMNRARGVAEGPGGDWMVLTAGDSLQAVLHAPLAAGTRSPSGWRGWARIDFRDVPLSAVTVEWSAVRAFDRARRDVPVGWTLTGGDGTVGGVLEARSQHLVAGEGDGPLLPVDGLYEVAGTLVLDGAEYAVHGLLRHTQGV